MRTSTFGYSKWAGVGVALLWQIALVVVVFALAILLWPPGLLGTPLSEINLAYLLRVAVSLFFLSVGLTSLYLVLVLPFAKSHSDLLSRRRD